MSGPGNRVLLGSPEIEGAWDEQQQQQPANVIVHPFEIEPAPSVAPADLSDHTDTVHGMASSNSIDAQQIVDPRGQNLREALTLAAKRLEYSRGTVPVHGVVDTSTSSQHWRDDGGQFRREEFLRRTRNLVRWISNAKKKTTLAARALGVTTPEFFQPLLVRYLISIILATTVRIKCSTSRTHLAPIMF
jgi:hypothetical protein